MHLLSHLAILQAYVCVCFAAVCPSRTNNTATARKDVVAVPAVWNGFGYLFNISVGTPPQPLTVLSDWTWISLFVRSGRCMNQWNIPMCIGNNGQAFFNERKSSTFHNRSLPQLKWDITAFAPDFTVDYASDTVCVSNICTTNTTLQVSDLPYGGDVIPRVPFGGIYGMAPVTPDVTEAFYTQNYQAWKAGIFGPKVGWHSCASLSSRKSCLGGEAKFVLGGTDQAMYDSSRMQVYNIQNPSWLSEAFYPYNPPKSNYWSTALTGVWISGEEEPTNFIYNFSGSNNVSMQTLALLDEGSEGLGAPLSLNAYKWLVKQVNGTLASNATVQAIMAQGSSGYNGASQDWYTVPCNSTRSRPTLVYELDGRQNYTIPESDYIIRLESAATPVCYLNVNVWKYGRTSSGDSKVLLLGGAFLKRLYVQLDFENLSFGLAPLKKH